MADGNPASTAPLPAEEEEDHHRVEVEALVEMPTVSRKPSAAFVSSPAGALPTAFWTTYVTGFCPGSCCTGSECRTRPDVSDCEVRADAFFATLYGAEQSFDRVDGAAFYR